MRLASNTIDQLPHFVLRPDYARAQQRRGIVHLGIGAFHRAHQAVYTDAAMNAGDRDWAITGVSLRSAGIHGRLTPQDGLYSVTERDGSGERTQLVGAVADVLVAPRSPDLVTAALASPDTRLVTITVTEKGYHLRPDGTLDLAAAKTVPCGLYDHLARGLAVRRNKGLPGLTLLSCDNLSNNGGALAAGLGAWLDDQAPTLRAWFDAECACPSSMVDRIVPAMTDARLAEIAATLGMNDEGAVVTEPFRQWVIEDRFAGSRPRWEAGGAQLVGDVAPFEAAKLRLLNGAHSAIAYLGLAAGHAHVHEAIDQPAIRAVVEQLMRNEAAATIATAPGQDLGAYADTLLGRFANPLLPHRLEQIASDGSQKVVPRLLGPLAINRVEGRRCPATLRAIAAWMRYVRGDGHPVDDPRADDLARLWRRAGVTGIADALFGSAGLIPAPAAIGEEERADLTRLVSAPELILAPMSAG